MFGAIVLRSTGLLNFNLADAAAIGIIVGIDGLTVIYVFSVLAPHLPGAIDVAAYSYMALVPLIRPPIMKALTNAEERKIVITQLRQVSKTEKNVFLILLLALGDGGIPYWYCQWCSDGKIDESDVVYQGDPAD